MDGPQTWAMKHGSLFSGIGGFDLAARWMGWENVFQAEMDPFCLQVLQHHFPECKRFTDVKTLKGGQYYGTVDIISAGFPCQPFSLAGRRKGQSDDRFLWPEAYRIITEIRPRWIVLENVAGLLSILDPEHLSEMEIKAAELFSADFGREDPVATVTIQRRIIGTIIGQIKEAGYILPCLADGTPVILCIPACATGAPHRRDRIWIVAYADDGGSHGAQNRQSHPAGDNRDSAGTQTAFQSQGCGGSATSTTPADPDHQSRAPQTGAWGKISGQKWEQRLWFESGTDGPSGSATNPDSDQRLQGGLYEAGSQTAERLFGALHTWDCRDPWRDFPAESPICRRNDGLPEGMAGISFSKWRRECIRGFGNAIIPQLALAIFEAIGSQKADAI